MDHPGPIARTIQDLAILMDTLDHRMSMHLTDGLSREISSFPRLGRLRGIFDEKAEEQVRLALEESLECLSSAGADIIDIELPAGFDGILAEHRIVMATEAAAFHQPILAEHPRYYQPKIRGLVEEGMESKAIDYCRSLQVRGRIRSEMLESWFRGSLTRIDALVLPATTSRPPSRESTGDPAFNSPWSFLGLPTLSFPVAQSPGGLPMAIQLVKYLEEPLFRTAYWCERVIREASSAATNP
jgi:aspartyl-tRNA(Asn)/glutamyl-tRNA(Gln) amidotransferase subunit A